MVYRWSADTLVKQGAPAALAATGGLAVWQHGEHCCIVGHSGLKARRRHHRRSTTMH